MLRDSMRQLKEALLQEMPITKFQHLGNWNKGSTFVYLDACQEDVEATKAVLVLFEQAHCIAVQDLPATPMPPITFKPSK